MARVGLVMAVGRAVGLTGRIRMGVVRMDTVTVRRVVTDMGHHRTMARLTALTTGVPTMTALLAATVRPLSMP